MKGISTNVYTTSSADCLKKKGYDFVIRYYSQTTKQPEKVILREEAEAIVRAGLQIAVVYQDAANYAAYFSHSEGKKDGYYAYYYAQKIHQPSASAVYFAVDYDASSLEIQQRISDYFRGVYQGFKDYSGGSPVYDIGVYGSGATCQWMRTHLPFVRYSWLAEATGWLGSKSYKDWNIKQFVTKETLCKLGKGTWQRNEAQSAFGAFTI